jgi:hypothetical protein
MWFAPCPLLGNGSLNTFPQKQTRGTVGDLLLGNGTLNRLCQQYRLCFPWGPCKVVIRESYSEAGSLVQKNEELGERERKRTRMERVSGSQGRRVRLKIDCEFL